MLGRLFAVLVLFAVPAATAAPAHAGPTAARIDGIDEETLFAVIKEQGATLGLGEEAERIFRTRSGRYYVPVEAERRQILALRRDPKVRPLLEHLIHLRRISPARAWHIEVRPGR